MKTTLVMFCALMLLCRSATAMEFRFSPRPNKAHLIQWRTWNSDAWEEAKKKDRPILLSLSAVWCHWCHVMDETTYSSDEIIAFINDNFIPIRVDVDMRPDIDSLYNQGGWPSTAVLTPQGEVLDGGNYVPLEEMREFLKRAIELFHANPAALAERIAVIKAGRELDRMRKGPFRAAPNGGELDGIAQLLEDSFDEAHGGFGTGQKFPNPDAIGFLLFRYAQGRDENAARIVTRTLDGMAKGGLNDPVEGGFFRYATKADWSEPHYEKMLDVNAGLIRNYADAFRVFGRKEHRAVLRQTIRYVSNNLYDDKNGAWYGSQDADEEYYRAPERKGLVPPLVDKTTYGDSSALMISALVAAYEATGEKRPLDMARKSAEFMLEQLYSEQEGVYHYLHEAEARRKGLLTDNALFGSALLELHNATGEKRYLNVARRLGGLLLERFYDPGERRFRMSIDGEFAKPVTAGMLSEVNENLANYRALCFLGRLAHWDDDAKLKKVRDDVAATFSGEYAGYAPHAAAYGAALLLAAGEPVEITVVTGGRKPDALLAVVRSVYLPRKVVRVLSIADDREEIRRLRYPAKKAVYLCAGKRCSTAITDREELRKGLRRFAGIAPY